MAFDPSTAVPVESAFDPNSAVPASAGFDPASAVPAGAPISEARKQADASAAVLGLDTPGVKEALNEYRTATGHDVPASEMDAFIGGALSGAVLDFNDELYGAYKALTSSLTENPNKKHAFWDYYRFFRDSARERKAQLWEEHPVMYGAGDIAGSLATSVALPGAGVGAKGASLATKALAAGARALPQGLGMATSDLTKGDVVGASVETIIFGSVATVLHGGGLALKDAVSKKLTSAAVEKYAGAVLQSDAPEKALNALEKHATAEAALVRNMTQPDVVFTEVERAAVNAKAMDRLTPELRDMLKRTTSTGKKGAIKEIVHEGLTPSERTAIELGDTVKARISAAFNKDQAMILQRAAKKAGVDIETYLGDQWVKETQDSLVAKLGKDRFNTLVAQMPTDKAPLLDTVHALRLAQETFEHSGEFNRTLGRSSGGFWSIANKFVDGREIYTALAERHGVNATKLIDDLTQQYNKLDVVRTKIAKEVRAFDKQYAVLVKSGEIPDANWLATMSELAADAPMPKTTKAQQDILKTFMAVTDGLAEAFGVEKQTAKAFYFPRVVRDARYIQKDLFAGIKAGEKLVNKSYDKWGDSELRALLSDKSFKEIYDGITYLRGGEASRPKTVVEMRAAITDLLDPEALEKALSIYSAPIHQRLSDTMPLWLRETNASAVIRKYVDSVGKYKMLSSNLAQLEGFQSLMEKRGDHLGSEYVRKHLQDITGGYRPGTLAAALSRTENQWVQFWDKATVNGNKVAPLLASLPDVAHLAMENMYPVYLGGRIDAPIRNLTGAAAQVWGEIGDTRYTAHLLWAGGAMTMKRGRTGINELIDKGFIQADHNAEWAETARRVFVNNPAVRGSRYTADAAMFFFRWSEKLARATTYNMADAMTGDLAGAISKKGVGLAADEASALMAARRMFSAMDNHQIEKFVAEGSVSGVRDIVTKRLMAKTQFNYNKANASEFAREAGPYLSMFTKWPTAIAGDLKNRMTDRTKPIDKRLGGVAYKYLLPFMLLGAVGQLLPGETETQRGDDYGIPVGDQVRGPDTVSQRFMEKVLGAGAISGYAPVQAVSPFVPGAQGNIFMSPLYSATKKLLMAATREADTKDRLAGISREAAPFVPFGSVTKLMFDINYVLTGYNPSKPE